MLRQTSALAHLDNAPSVLLPLCACLLVLRFAYCGICLNELTGLQLYCTPAQLTPKGVCPYTKGEQLIKAFGFDFLPIGGHAAVLLIQIFGFRAIAYLGVRYGAH